MPRLTWGRGFVQVNVDESRAERGEGEAGGGGKRARGHDGEAHMGLVE